MVVAYLAAAANVSRPLPLEGAIRWHDDRSLLIAQRHDLEEQIGALQAPRAQRSSRMPPSSRAVFSRGRARQGLVAVV